MKSSPVRPVILATMLFAICGGLNAQPYKNLANIVADIQGLAAGSGGDAAADTLKDDAGVEIHTGGLTAGATPIWQLKIAMKGS